MNRATAATTYAVTTGPFRPPECHRATTAHPPTRQCGPARPHQPNPAASHSAGNPSEPRRRKWFRRRTHRGGTSDRHPPSPGQAGRIVDRSVAACAVPAVSDRTIRDGGDGGRLVTLDRRWQQLEGAVRPHARRCQMRLHGGHAATPTERSGLICDVTAKKSATSLRWGDRKS